MINFILKKDINKLLSYIETNWNKNHIFLKNIDVFNFQHNTKYDYYNFLGITRNEEFTSIMGLININRNSDKQIWLALWHSISGLDGYLLLNFVLNKLKPDFIGVLGISNIAKNIYKIKGFEIGFLSHYYVSKPNAKIKLLNNNLITEKVNQKYELLDKIDLDSLKILESVNYAPIKEPNYYIKRYQKNKFYQYQFLKIYNDNKLVLILIGRSIIINDYKIFHCVDCVGDLNNVKFKYIAQQFILKNNFDVLELLYYSKNESKIDLFLKQNNEVIPSYFSPFINKNITIELAFKSNKTNVRFFIGDSDQDRPNS